MPPATTLVLGSDQDVVDVGSSLLGRGNAVDAVAGSVFAAAALYPSVLLGPVQILIGGAGSGLRAIDGRNRQPGLGNPRPRGFLPSEPIPPAARVGAPGLPAALLAAVTTYGKMSVAAVLGPAMDLARPRSKGRLHVLGRIAQRGPAALSEAVLSDELVACAGRLAGGLLSVRDLDELRPEVTSAASHVLGGRREVLTVPWGASAVRDADASSLQAGGTRISLAVDRHGMVAVACYAVASASEGLHLEALDLLAPFSAIPVLRGQQRVKAGEVRPSAAPIALAQTEGVLDLAVGIGSAVDAETALHTWLESYRPLSELERDDSPPLGLVAVQRAGDSWAEISNA